MLMTAAKIELLHVPYKGAGAAIMDLLGGHADLTSVVPGSVIQQIQAGTLIPLAITGKAPHYTLPSVPTFASVGLGAVNPGQFRFLVAPAGLPAAIQKKIAAAMRTVLEPQDFRTRLSDNGFDVELLVGADARAYIAREISKWRQAVKDAGLRAPNIKKSACVASQKVDLQFFAALALEDDFVGLLGDGVVRQAGDRLHEIPRRLLDQQVRDPGMDQPLPLVVRHGQQPLQGGVNFCVVARGQQQADEAFNICDRAWWCGWHGQGS